ncbi:MAG: HEXXH motif-containing putative peptide modification protein [Azospirillaceae bacterium]
MSIAMDFEPDAARAVALDRRMNRELGLSLEHVAEQARGHAAFDRAGLGALVAHLLAGGRVRPGVFGRYYDLVHAIDAEDRAEIERLMGELAAAAPMPPELEITALGDATLGRDSALYMRKWQTGGNKNIGFREPSAEIAQAFRPRLADGLALLESALPELHGEIRAIVHQVVIAGSDPDTKLQFDGGSHYQLWGALFLNGHFHPDRVAVAEVLAHESAHSLLFGFCTHMALVDNDDDAVFSSPLRRDPRPMDGIYHATFVSARMHWAMTALARSGALTDEEAARAHAAAEADRRNFYAGHGVVAEHGLLTPVGTELMAGAKAYMESVGAPEEALATAG